MVNWPHKGLVSLGLDVLWVGRQVSFEESNAVVGLLSCMVYMDVPGTVVLSVVHLYIFLSWLL